MNSRVIKLCLLIGVIGALLASVTMASAQSGPEEDGRINAAAEFDYAIYCVDENNNPANAYSTGGIRVLNAQGQEVLFVPNATIVEVGDTPAVNMLLGESPTVPGLALYRRTDGGFQLNGFDRHGKAFEFEFYSCAPILPPDAPDEPEDEDECDDIIIDIAFRGQSPQGGDGEDPCIDHPCDVLPFPICCLLRLESSPLDSALTRVVERVPVGNGSDPCECMEFLTGFIPVMKVMPPNGRVECPEFIEQVNYV